MKKTNIIAAGIAVLPFTVVGTVFAGGIDNLHNFSAEYVRTFNRNAATDSADAVVYNPAGTVEMANGSYVNLSLQYLDKDYKNKIGGTSNGQDGTVSQDEPSIIPGFFGLYKNDKWAAYAAVTVPSGGGKVVYEQGSATVQIANAMIGAGGSPVSSPMVEAESVYIGVTLGTAYKVCDKVSLSAGVRHIQADKSSRIDFIAAGGAVPVVVDYESEADGWAGILGINYRPIKDLNLAARYEMRTRLDFEYTINHATNGTGSALLAAQGITNKMKERRDLPAIVGLGASYQVNPALKIDTNLTYYLHEDANWAGDENNIDTGYDAGISFEYAFNEKIRGSIGYMYTDPGEPVQSTLAESPKLAANSVGTGIAYSLNDNLEMNFSAALATYADDSYLDASGLTIGYEKKVIFYAYGVQYKF